MNKQSKAVLGGLAQREGGRERAEGKREREVIMIIRVVRGTDPACSAFTGSCCRHPQANLLPLVFPRVIQASDAVREKVGNLMEILN